MSFIPQIAFLFVLLIFSWLIFKRFSIIKRLIGLGKPSSKKIDPSRATKRMLLFAFGQKRMFDKPLVGVFHFIIYMGFILINLEVLEIIIDGILGTHRLFAPLLGGLYPLLIGFFEFLSLGVFLACSIFLVRRNLLRVRRFHQKEMTSWPKLDGNLILLIEILLVSAILFMDAADQEIQARGISGYRQTGVFLFSSFLVPAIRLLGDHSLVILERSLWWFHILGILSFIVYISFSKHLHIFLAFPNTYLSDPGPIGQIENMPDITKEVKIMLGMENQNEGSPPESFGAKDIFDLPSKSLLDAFSCTECGRCTEQCPANQTGKLLSPRKIMMDTRDRMEEIGASGKLERDGKNLIRDYILEEEILACTSCQACIEACPIQINPLSIILELRRYLVMEESKTPQEWTTMMTNIENNSAPWAFPAADRFNWASDLNQNQS
jgi:heterodisulfide reductase subunit C